MTPEPRTTARKTAAVLVRETESAWPLSHWRVDEAPGTVLATGGIKRKFPGPALEKVKSIWSSS